MAKHNGFTLLELLIVLSIWSLLVLLSVPILVKNLDEQEIQQFFKVFEHDVLYIQYVATTSANKEASIHFGNGYYTVRNGSTNQSIRRDFPSNWKIDTRSIQYISFNNKGTIRQAGTIEVETNQSNYSVVFPLGKGRGYVVKQ